MNLVELVKRFLRRPVKVHPMAAKLRSTADRQERQAQELQRLRALQAEQRMMQRRNE